MRLLNTSNLELKWFGDDEAQQYAILSHTWGEEEVTLQDMEGTHPANKKGYGKVKDCCSVARANGFEYVWIDTCCIDKTSSAELSEAINSMYRWYQEAEVCYAYLTDVPSKKGFSDSRWFSRGWTLQELIAPSTVIFFDEEWKTLGTKETLRQEISDCTCIPISLLSGDDDLETYSIAQRMSWASKRKTSRVEDRAYCLLGIFGIYMPLIYGERETAFIRLQEEIMKISDDYSLFAWRSQDNRSGLLATSPASFTGSYNIVQSNPFGVFNSPLSISSRGIYLELRFMGRGRQGLGLAILHCKERDKEGNSNEGNLIGIYVRDLDLTMERFERVQSEEFEQLDLKKFRPSQYPVRRVCIQGGRMRKAKALRESDSIYPEMYSESMLSSLMDFGEPRALVYAAPRGLQDVVWLLLTRSDIKVNLKDANGETALSHAVKQGHTVVVKMLLAHKEVNTELKDKSGRTSLSFAAERGHGAVVKLLLDKGADLEAKDKDRTTPLLYAAIYGHKTVVKLLLDRGADLEAKDIWGATPLQRAVINPRELNQREAVVKLLLDKGANFNLKDGYGQTPLWFAVKNGHEGLINLLLDKGADLELKDKFGQTPLWWAVKKVKEGIVKLLLGKSANIESKDKFGQTPLWWAASNGEEALVKLLLSKSANLEVKDRFGQTPLLCAADNGHEVVVKLLLDKGANIELEDNYGQTAVSLAVKNGHKAVVELLQSHLDLLQ